MLSVQNNPYPQELISICLESVIRNGMKPWARGTFVFSNTLTSQNDPVKCMIVLSGSGWLIDLAVTENSNAAQLLPQIGGQVQCTFQWTPQEMTS